MIRIVLAVLLLAILVALYATNLGVLVWRSDVKDLGEGGPSFDCYFFGAMGPVRVGYFYSSNSDVDRPQGAQRSHCPSACFLAKHTVRVGTREIQAWQCTSDGLPAPRA